MLGELSESTKRKIISNEIFRYSVRKSNTIPTHTQVANTQISNVLEVNLGLTQSLKILHSNSAVRPLVIDEISEQHILQKYCGEILGVNY
eukprot:snap_masked-scaffold_9-processed-gene-9.13-mRNA-1 protein AED:1.00 eAED:1.00 QI:0/0/0/0/1/1/2/0/89